MRFLPRIKVLQEELDLHIINIDKAIERLLKDKMTGYLLFSFDAENEALILLERGKIKDQFYRGPEKMLRGVEAKEEIADWLSKAKGHVDIVELNDNAFRSVVSLLYGDSYFGPLESTFINFTGLLNQINKDTLTGCLTIDGDEDNVLIFINEGKPSSLYFRGVHIRKGEKQEVSELVEKHVLELQFYLEPTKLQDESQTRISAGEIEQKRESLHLQKIVRDGQVWFEDQYGNSYKKSQIKDLWEKYHLIL
ncbi:hypothetical protein JXQ70_01180 [bacterium]|nr:hypothetical protein [bacterium]